ncbi:MAG TPA: hypothetical protein VFD58_27265 [Blastocatellia bacterium]|nr:hypothetical protein [Blastocatellia bacterium]
MNFALAKIRTMRPEVGENNFIIGEVGFPRTDFGECYAAETLRETLEGIAAPDSFRVSYVNLWQIVDNGLIWDSDGWPGFGMYRPRNGKLELTMSGRFFQAFLANQPFTIPTDCPRVRRSPVQGVLDSQTGSPDLRLYPDSVMAIYAQGCCQNSTTPFSATDNTVRFRQAYRESALTRDNSQVLSESTVQVNASIPSSRQPGQVMVYITDQRGIDSNAQPVELRCDACPAIRQSFGILDAATQMGSYSSGSVISIYGEKFSAAGNIVTIEQLDNQQKPHAYQLPHDNVWSESTSLITARLPQELVIDRFALVYVTDAQGHKSNLARILVGAECRDCGPGLPPLLPVVNRASRQADFHPGTSIEIRGVNFSATGNQVIVEQSDKHYVLPQNGVWSESPAKITAPLPTTLLPGHAIVYVVDATVRESRAIDLTITSNPVASVSAASYSPAALAPEAIAAAFGTGLATTTTGATVTPLPTSLAGTSISVRDSAGVERVAPLFFVSPTQVNYQIPASTAPGLATVTITGGDGSISTGTMQIAAVAPGLFSADASGNGIAAAVAVRARADGTQIYEDIARFDTSQNRYVAIPIDLGPDQGGSTDQVYLALFGTGFRYRSAESNVAVKVGGIDAPVTYAGAQLQLVGLDQINMRLPRTLIGRGEVDITVTADGRAANTVRVNIK